MPASSIDAERGGHDRSPYSTPTLARRSSSRQSRRSSRRGSSSVHAVPEVSRARLCIQGFFYANQYEGPYGKHIAVIIHSGNALSFVGVVLVVISFSVYEEGLAGMWLKMMSCVFLTLGFSTSLSTATVYARAHKNTHVGANGRLNLQSKDILLQIASAINMFLILLSVVIIPLSFVLAWEISFFNYFKVVGFAYLILGTTGLFTLCVYSRTCKGQRNTPSCSRQQRRQQSLRTENIPEIRVESDTTSENAGSDITEAYQRRGSVVTPSFIDAPSPLPPPYSELDPNPSGWSDASSSVNNVSATHSMVTLLQHAYAEELETQSPPPPYCEVEANRPQQNALGTPPQHSALSTHQTWSCSHGEQLTTSSTTQTCPSLASSYPQQRRDSQEQCHVNMQDESWRRPSLTRQNSGPQTTRTSLQILQTESSLTVPDL